MKLTIFDLENWKEIGATLMRNKTRTFLTGFGIFWGVAMLALLTGGVRGGEGLLRRNFAGFTTNSGGIIAETTTKPYHGYQKGRRWNLDLKDVQLIKDAFPEVDAVIPAYSNGSTSMKKGKYSYSGFLSGFGPEYRKMLEPRLYCGRFINEADEHNERRVAVIGKKVATQLFPTNPEPLGETVEIDGGAYTVVGVAGDVSEVHIMNSMDESAVIPSSTFRRVRGYGDQVDFILITGKKDARLSELFPKIRQVVNRRHDVDPTDKGAMFTINIAEMFEQVDMLFMGVDLLAWFIGLSTLLAGVIGIGNIMWVIVKERTQEIGIRRAIGAKPIDIIVQVLSEGVALTFFAGTAGVCFAALLLGVMNKIQNPPDAVSEVHFQMSFAGAVGILALFVALGTLAGLIPSIKAMKIKPVEAINDK